MVGHQRAWNAHALSNAMVWSCHNRFPAIVSGWTVWKDGCLVTRSRSLLICQTNRFGADIWLADLCMYVSLCICLRGHACGWACVRLCVTPHQSESHFCSCACCCGSWPCFCHCISWLCCSASLTYHYSLKYCMGRFLSFPLGMSLPHLSGMPKIHFPPGGEF